MKIATRLKLLVAVPVCALIVLGSMVVREELGAIRRFAAATAHFELAVAVERMAHELQIERGLSVGFVHSGKAAFKVALLAHRQKVDVAIDVAQRAFGVAHRVVGDDLPHLSVMDEALAGLMEGGMIGHLRGAVDVMAGGDDDRFESTVPAIVVASYTDIIRRLLGVFGEISRLVPDVDVASKVKLWAKIEVLKDLEGQQRALLGAAFARDSFAPAHLRAWRDVVSQRRGYREAYFRVASDDERRSFEELEEIIRGDTASRMVALAAARDGAWGIGPLEWFDVATERINRIAEFAFGISSRIKDRLAELRAQAETRALGALALVALFVLVAISLQVINASMLSRPAIALAGIASSLRERGLHALGQVDGALGDAPAGSGSCGSNGNCASDSDGPVPSWLTTRNDEFGELGRAFGSLCVELLDREQRLLASNADLRSFAHVAAHDLKAPLRQMAAFAGFLREDARDKLDERGQRDLAYIHESAERLQALIADLLSFSELDAASLEVEDVAIGEVVDAVLTDFVNQVEKEKALLVVDVDGLPDIRADQRLLRLLLQNLIGNALKYTRPGVPARVYVRQVCEKNKMVRRMIREAEAALLLAGRDLGGATAAAVDLLRFFGRPDGQAGTMKHHVHFVGFEVVDEGIGFEIDDAEKVFSPFTRLVSSKEYAGTGVGLAIVKRVVDLHHGAVVASGGPNEGARFVVYLPAA